MRGSIADPAHPLLSHFDGLGAPLAAATLPGAAPLLVGVWTVTRAFPRMIGSPILSPPWCPVWPRLVSCPSLRGRGSRRSGRDITPRNGTQDAQAQEDHQQTRAHGSFPCSRETRLPVRRCPAPFLHSATILPRGRGAGRARRPSAPRALGLLPGPRHLPRVCEGVAAPAAARRPCHRSALAGTARSIGAPGGEQGAACRALEGPHAERLVVRSGAVDRMDMV